MKINQNNAPRIAVPTSPMNRLPAKVPAWFLACFVALLALAGSLARAQDTSLTMLSQPGDYIGQGLSYSFSAPSATFSASKNYHNGVTVSAQSWTLNFAGPAYAPLKVGVYNLATRFPFQEIGRPGLSVSGDGRGSNTLTGFFEVKKITYGAGNTILSFWAIFEQHSEGAGPALTGEIKYRADATDLPVNQAPGVYATATQRISLAASASLTGLAEDDGLPNPVLTTTWSRVSGPGTVVFGNTAARNTSATFNAPGQHVLRLTANDGALSATSEVTVTVYDPNELTSLTMVSQPGDYIGAGQNYAFGVVDGNFTATQSSGGVAITFSTPSGAPVSNSWNLTFATPANAPLKVGTYLGAARFPFQAITQPGLSVSGNGRGSNTLTGFFEVKKITYGAGNTLLSFWATFEQHSEGAVPALIGEIKYRADATDLPVNQVPGVYAGAAQRISLAASASLAGLAEDDGLPNPVLTTTWSRVSGPGTVVFGNAAARNTSATFNAPGQHVLRLTANDGALSATSTVTVTVYDPNELTSLTMVSQPGDYIGAGQNYAFGVADGSFTATRSGGNGVAIAFSTPSGAPVSNSWNLTFVAPVNAPLKVGTYLGAARYPFQAITQPGLSVSGNGRGSNTLTGFFEVKKITYGAGNTILSFWATFEQHSEGAVPALTGEIKYRADATDLPVNQTPGVYAGVAQRISLASSVSLAGLADDDGLPNPVLTTTWSRVSGPGAVAFADAAALSTTATFTAAGQHTLRLTASDGVLSRTSDLVVTVFDPNANAVLSMTSDAGDYIGGGKPRFFTIADGDFEASKNGDNGVSISFYTADGARNWSLSFAAPGDALLSVGTYLGAVRHPFQSSTQPGLSVSGEGRGSNTLTGFFEVKQIVYGAGNTIERFWATFEQHSEGAIPALRGEVRINVLPPVGTVAPLAVTSAATGVTTTAVALNGSVNPNGSATTAVFDYSLSPTLATGVQTVSVTTQPGSGTAAVAVTAPLTGLAPGKTYYFRARALNAGGPASGQILAVTTPAPLPTVTTGSATAVGILTATLNGTVNPNGSATTAAFEYSTTNTFTVVQTVSVTVQPGSGTSAVAVNASLTGLTPGTQYFFRLTATNPGGPRTGATGTFTTLLPALPVVVAQAATDVGPLVARLNATVNPGGGPTTASFDYNTSPTLAGTVTNVPVMVPPPNVTTAFPVFAALSGLAPQTTYYFRPKATNARGTATGGILSFTTPLQPVPVVFTGAASAIVQTTATLNGTVNPNGAPTTATFRYGTSPTLVGALTVAVAPGPGSGSGAVAVSAGVSGLVANTTYYYRLLATNAGGSGQGTIQSFTTLPNPPLAVTVVASGIGFTSATLNGLVKGNGFATTYRFDWGVGGLLDQATPAQALVDVNVTQVVSAALSGLALNTDYSFRVRATNVGGTTLGATLTFSTPPLTIGPDGRYTLVAGKTWTLGQDTIIPGDLIIEGTLVPNGFRLTVLGTVTVRPGGVIVDPNGTVFAFFRDGVGPALVNTQLARLETVATFGLVGAQPMAALLEGGDGWMYGTTAAGGKSGAGTAFRVTRSGEVEMLGNFTGPNGSAPQSALVGTAATGIFGTTTTGGTLGMGTVFRVNPAGGIVPVTGFNGVNGRAPNGGLTVGAGGVLYGVASGGGAANKGTLFRISAAGAIEKLVDFTGPNGAVPQAALVLGSDGALYGVTTYGGATNTGTVFRFDPAGGGLAVLASLSGGPGLYPVGGLVEGAPGVFYGTCYAGGANGLGTVFRVGGGAGATLLASFTAAVGAEPIGPLARGADGNFYGTTYSGVNGYGAVFKVTDAGTLTRVTSVIGNGGLITGAHPGAGLLLGTDGAWYGVSQDGGAAGRGAVFRVLLSGVMENVASFTDTALPSGLTLGSVDGQLYGTTQKGGAIGFGSVFALAPRAAVTTLASFAPGFGQEPQPGAGVVFGADGTTLFGTTAQGGLGQGVVWKLPAGGTLAALVSFNGPNGSAPLGGLVAAGDGGFYGTTSGGGSGGGAGSIFKISPTGVFTPQAAFSGANGGAPQAALIANGAGTFAGTTRAGGSAGKGALYQFTPGGALAAVASFSGADGQEPLAPLLRAADGTLAGTTAAGGANSAGTIFQLAPGGSAPTTLRSFAGSDGAAPRGPLAATGDGGFFGTTSAGGGFGRGTVFRLGALGTLQNIAHLTGDNDGATPTTGLLAAPDGYLYGSTDSTVFRVPFGPSVTTLAASAFTPTQTTLRGEILPRGLATTATFEWGPTPALGQTLAAGASASPLPVAVQATLPALAAATTYYYRVTAANVMGVKRGSVLKFKTPALIANGGGNFTLPAGSTWTLPGDFTFAGNLTVLGTLDTAGRTLTVVGKLTIAAPGSVLNPTGVIAYLDRDGALPPGALRLLGDAATDLLDLDGDGLNSLMEFVLGTNPSTFTSGALPVPALIAGRLTLTYRTPAGISGVQALVEASSDLLNWQSGPGFTAVTSDTIAAGVRTVIVRADLPGSPQYLRLRATR